jgi:hypothetical protein
MRGVRKGEQPVEHQGASLHIGDDVAAQANINELSLFG